MRINSRALCVAAVILSLPVLGGCSESSEGNSAGYGAAFHANGDQANTRYVNSSITPATVADLGRAWSLPLEPVGEDRGAIGSPVVADGIAFFQDSKSNVMAIGLSNGEMAWERRYEKETLGPNGVVVADGKVFGATPERAFALDAETGEEIWSANLLRRSSETISMTPGYHEGRVFFSTQPGEFAGNEVGVLWALDADSGKRLWRFDTVPRALWGDPEINWGGGLSHPPAFDGEGSLYIGTGNPGPIAGTRRSPWGSSRPGPNPYTNSIVKLDEKTGKFRWSYQVTPHGLCNWDVGAPVLTEDGNRKVVVAASLGGIVVSVDRETGDLLWRRPVGMHNGHDHDGLAAMRGEYGKLTTPMTVFPGALGGIAGPISIRGSTIFAPVVDRPTRLISQQGATAVSKGVGQLVALDVASGAVKWKHRFASSLYGPVATTNDLVFASTREGLVYAFDTESGKEIWRESLLSVGGSGLTVSGDSVVFRTGSSSREVPELVTYRLAS